MNRPSTRTAFTIVELLVTISVVGVLSAIAVAALGSGRKAADRTAEVAAARQLATGYALGAQDNGGKFLPAKPSQEAVPFMEVKDLNGNNILHGAAIERITFRLLPYVGDIEAFYPGPAKEHLEVLRKRENPYDISLHPTLGFNVSYIGGDYQSRRYSPMDGARPHIAATSMAQIPDPSTLVLFVSSFLDSGPSRDTSAGFTGSVHVYPPNGTSVGGSWTGDYNEKISANLGRIHLRHNGKAVVANMDGSVELLGEEELRDMRRWSHQAQRSGDKDYSP